MALTVNFQVSQNILSPSSLVIGDVSTGSDASIVTRHVYLQLANGSYLVPSGITTDYNNWPEPSAVLTLDVLDQDYAINIKIDWLNISGTIVYTKQQVYSFTLYSEQYYYTLTQQQAGGYKNISDTNYFNNKQQLRVFIDSANNAVEFASDIYGAQEQLDSANYMISNQNLYF